MKIANSPLLVNLEGRYAIELIINVAYDEAVGGHAFSRDILSATFLLHCGHSELGS